MASPLLGEIRIFSFAFAPKGWALANGQILSIQQNQALFSLLGTTYGGDGQFTFALPNLQGRVAMSFNGNHPQGQSAGEASHTLTIQETPPHTHVPNATNALGTQSSPASNFWANDSNGNATFGTTPDTPNASPKPAAIGNAGGGQSHSNMMPYLTMNFCIALQGIFPSQN